MDTLQAFDIHDINPFTYPLLNRKYLVLSNPTNEKRHLEHHFLE